MLSFKSLYWGKVAHPARAYHGFQSMSQSGVSLFFPWIGSWSIEGLTPSISPGFPKNLPVPTYILGWAEALWGEGFWSRTQHTDQVIGLKCGPLNPKSNALNIKPLHLHCWTSEREHLLPKLTLVELWHHCPVVRDYQHTLKNKVHMCST